MSGVWRGLLAALRRSSPLAREIAGVLLVKTVLLSLLFHGLSRGPAPDRPAALDRTAQQLLGLPVGPGENTDGR